MKYKVGDKVRIVSEKPDDDTGWNKSGNMDVWLGKEMTIKSVTSLGYQMEEDQGENKDMFLIGLNLGWFWDDDMIEGLVEEDSTPTLLNTTVKCTESNSCYFTKGKVYQVINGFIKCDDGDKFPFGHPLPTMEALEKYFTYDGWKLKNGSFYKYGTSVKFEEVKNLKVRSIFGDDLGTVGEDTDIIDANNIPLHVGDVVTMFDPDGDYAGKGFICKTIDEDHNYAPMGLMSLHFDGTEKDYQIFKYADYQDMKAGNVLNFAEITED